MRLHTPCQQKLTNVRTPSHTRSPFPHTIQPISNNNQRQQQSIQQGNQVPSNLIIRQAKNNPRHQATKVTSTPKGVPRTSQTSNARVKLHTSHPHQREQHVTNPAKNKNQTHHKVPNPHRQRRQHQQLPYQHTIHEARPKSKTSQNNQGHRHNNHRHNSTAKSNRVSFRGQDKRTTYRTGLVIVVAVD